VSALRQNVAGAGIDLGTLTICLDRGDVEAARRAVERMTAHLAEADRKLSMAINNDG